MDSEEHLEETRRIVWAKVAKRMAEEYGLQQKEAGETERFDGVLSLWIDLQQAVLAVEEQQLKPEGCTSWNCPDPRVTKAWTALTVSMKAFVLVSKAQFTIIGDIGAQGSSPDFGKRINTHP